MDWLNYHHLLYFRAVARAGTIAGAAEELKLSPSAISTQLKDLEASLGQALFRREGRRLALTEIGKIAFRFADDIFRLGDEMQAVVRGGGASRNVRLEVGLVQAIPPLVALRLLEPTLQAVPGLRLVCRRGSLDELVAALSAHELDVVLTEEPATERMRGRTYDHRLGDCGITFFAPGKLARLAKGFPKSLDGAPVVLPIEPSALRRGLDAWFPAQGVHPTVVAEFGDWALLRAFARRGLGFFAGPSIIEDEIRRYDGVSVIGRTEAVRERYYALTVDRRLKHPGVAALAETARTRLFG